MKVLYIGGEGRSGSTLISHYLGKFDNVFVAGELSWLWERGFVQNELCGCGKDFLSCPEWNRILNGLMDDLNRDKENFRSIWKERIRTRYLVNDLTGIQAFRDDPLLDEYVEATTTIYRRIQALTGCSFIVDSSKSPVYAFLLNNIAEIDLYLLHLVRDPRAVAFSRQRRKVRPEDGQEMIRFKPAFSALIWSINNLAIDLLRTRLGSTQNYFRVRYEDFVSDPMVCINELVERMPDLFGLRMWEHYNEKSKSLHTVSGNPVRFELGSMEIKPDFEWKREMKSFQRIIVGLITMPLIKRYGYQIFLS